MEHNTLFRLVYTFISGVVIALFFGIGVQAFYEPPKAPEFGYPSAAIGSKDAIPSEAEIQKQQEMQRQFESEQKAYDKVHQEYSRNVAIILLVLAVVAVAAAFAAAPKAAFLSDGVLLGGLFTLLHSIVRGFSANDTKTLFAISTVAVVIVLYLGYRRFLRPAPSTKNARS